MVASVLFMNSKSKWMVLSILLNNHLVFSLGGDFMKILGKSKEKLSGKSFNKNIFSTVDSNIPTLSSSWVFNMVKISMISH